MLRDEKKNQISFYLAVGREIIPSKNSGCIFTLEINNILVKKE